MSKGELKQSIKTDLEGNLVEQSRSFEKALERMGQRGEKHLSGMARMSSVAGRGLDKLGNRYAGLISGAAVSMAIRQVGNLSERYTRLGIQANISADRVDGLKQEVFAASQLPHIRVDPSEIIGAIEQIVEKTGDLDFAQANIENIGLAIQATGAAGADIGGMLAEFQKQGIVAPGEVLRTLDTMNQQGKEGAFTLQDIARLGPRVVAAYTATGRSGTQAMKEMGAALQVVRQGTGSSEQAATAFEAVLRTMASPEKIKKLQELGGIEIFDPELLKEGRQQLRPINELMVEIVKASSGKQTNLAEVFDSEAMRAFNSAAAEFQRTGAVESLDKFMRVNGDGTATMEDSARAAKEFNAAVTGLKTSWGQFADENLTEPVRSLADLLNSADRETVQLGLNTAKWGAGILAALIAGRKVYGVYKGISGLMAASAAKKAIGGTLGSAAAGMKPIPVFVVNNMPGGMGAGKAGAAGAAGWAAKTFGKARTTAALLAGTKLSTLGTMGAGAIGAAGLGVAGAGAAGYGAGTLLNDHLISGTAVGDKIGETLNQLVAFFGSQASRDALEINRRHDQQQATLKVEIVGNGNPVRVREMNATGFEMDVDAGPTMGGF